MDQGSRSTATYLAAVEIIKDRFFGVAATGRHARTGG
jgi:hypothetical protein